MTGDDGRGDAAGAVLIGRPDDDERADLAALHASARDAAGDVRAAVALAGDLGRRLPVPGTGRTAHLWSALATLGAADLTVARVVEPHLDALAILRQAGDQVGDRAGDDVIDGTWGVYAAEGPGEPLRARSDGDGHLLDGRKHWCSVAADVDHALVSARVGTERQLFAVDLRQDGVAPVPGTWVARGLAGVDSGPVDFTAARARAVGQPGWYLERPGFAWGAIGVAAVWFGGAVGVARRLLAASRSRTPDQVAEMHLGGVDARLHAAACVLAQAASELDAGALAGAAGWRSALRVREVVAGAAEDVLRRAGHGLGPGPLATDEDHARRVADLDLYLRQWHAERDAAALGREVLREGTTTW